MKTLVIANQKGGVGKSGLCVNLSHRAVEEGKRVLLVDLDPMHSLSLVNPSTGYHEGPASVASHLFNQDATIIPEKLSENLAILRGDDTLSLLTGDSEDRAKRPARYLRDLASEYDLCIIDTPGMLGVNPPMTVAGMVAADVVLCPFSIGVFEAAALRTLLEYIGFIRNKGYNPRLRMMGLLPSKINPISKDEAADLETLRDQFKKVVLPFTLFERISVKRAIGQQKPVWRGTKGGGHAVAGKEWKTAMTYILTNLGVLK